MTTTYNFTGGVIGNLGGNGNTIYMNARHINGMQFGAGAPPIRAQLGRGKTQFEVSTPGGHMKVFSPKPATRVEIQFVAEDGTKESVTLPLDNDAACRELDAPLVSVKVSGNIDELHISQGDVSAGGNIENVKSSQGTVYARGDVEHISLSAGNVVVLGNIAKASVSCGSVAAVGRVSSSRVSAGTNINGEGAIPYIQGIIEKIQRPKRQDRG